MERLTVLLLFMCHLEFFIAFLMIPPSDTWLKGSDPSRNLKPGPFQSSQYIHLGTFRENLIPNRKTLWGMSWSQRYYIPLTPIWWSDSPVYLRETFYFVVHLYRQCTSSYTSGVFILSAVEPWRSGWVDVGTLFGVVYSTSRLYGLVGLRLLTFTNSVTKVSID